MNLTKFIADFHIHSKYSHATSKFMDLQSLALWGQFKGIAVMGTGDFTHPIWQKELVHQLQQDEFGLFELKSEFAKIADDKVYGSCKNWQKFLLTSEISTIFKRNGKCYRTHSILLAPDFVSVEKITQKLSKIGNLVHDGRPILGLDVIDLLKIVLDASPDCMLIPAHIWTPWFGLLGSKSGFNSLHEAFGDMTSYIYAVEKGLSSNFLMNAQLSQLDHLAILCNSDAHSLQNLGREANVMYADLSYRGILQALQKNDPANMIAGIEFFPERGKYYGDGHRACNVYLTPQETNKCSGLCKVCSKSVTLGVLHRVTQLADRTSAQAEKFMRKRHQVVPLFDILKINLKIAITSKKLIAMYHKILSEVGNEFFVLLHAPLEQIAKASTPEIAQLIGLMRKGEIVVQPGYDGVYGQIQS